MLSQWGIMNRPFFCDKVRKLVLGSMFLFLCCGNGYSETTNKVVPDWLKQQSSFSPQGYFNISGELIIGFFIIIGLAGIGGLFLLRRIFLSRAGGRQLNFRVLSRFYLSPKAFLCVIELDGNRYLLGVGDGTISLLADLGRSKEFQSLVNQQLADLQESKSDEYVEFIREINAQIKQLKQAVRKKMQ